MEEKQKELIAIFERLASYLSKNQKDHTDKCDDLTRGTQRILAAILQLDDFVETKYLPKRTMKAPFKMHCDDCNCDIKKGQKVYYNYFDELICTKHLSRSNICKCGGLKYSEYRVCEHCKEK